MAEEVVTVAPVATPTATEAAPSIAAVTTAPVVEAVPPATEAAPVVETAPVTEPVAETQKPLLNPESTETKSTEAVVDAPKPEADIVPLPVYEFKLPEGAQTDNQIFKSFNSKLGEFQNLSKTEQVAVQKFGQDMIDLHIEDVKAVVENANKSAWEWFKNRNSEWLENSKKDTEIGGENWDKTINSASQAISLYGGSKAQQIETAKLLQETGVENHPAMLRFLSNITKVAAKEGTPVTGANAPLKSSGSIAEAMYGGKKTA